ncbi:MAG: alpha/beta hydrolase [Gemmatimonadaceae bacterium]
MKPLSRHLPDCSLLIAALATVLLAYPRESKAQAEGRVDVTPAAQLFYHIEGTGADTIVVLHGGPAFGYGYMAPNLAALGRRHVLIYYDQRGAGRSTLDTITAHLTIEQHVEDLDQLRRAFKLQAVTLLGHSWGGMLAAQYAIAHPSLTRRVILVDPMTPAQALRNLPAQTPLPVDSATLQRVSALFGRIADAPDPLATCRELFSPELIYRLYFADSTSASRFQGDFCARPVEALRASNVVVQRTMMGLGPDFDVRQALSTVLAPVLVLRGMRGAIAREAMVAWTRGFKNARLVEVAGAGHYLWVDQPDAFLAAVEAFLVGGWPKEAITPE